MKMQLNIVEVALMYRYMLDVDNAIHKVYCRVTACY